MKITKTFLVVLVLVGTLVGTSVGAELGPIISNSVNVSVTQATLLGIALTVNGTSGSIYGGVTHPGDKLIIAATTNPAIAGYNITFYDNSTVMNQGGTFTNSNGNVQGVFTVPPLINPPNSDCYNFTAKQT